MTIKQKVILFVQFGGVLLAPDSIKLERDIQRKFEKTSAWVCLHVIIVFTVSFRIADSYSSSEELPSPLQLTTLQL